MREDEEFAKQRYEAYLSRVLDKPEIKWTDGDEPPDYYLVINSEEFAVEVTTLMEMVNLDDEKIERIGIDASRDSLVYRVERRAKDKSLLSGTYIVSFALPTSDFSRLRPQIEQSLLDYIERTQYDVSPIKEKIVINGKACCSVQKGGNSKPQVIVGRYPTTTQWEENAKQEMCRLLQEALITKSKKLSRISLPKILLLLDKNHFIAAFYYRHCPSSTTPLQDFHTVFVVDPLEKPDWDIVLYTSNPDWGQD